MIKCLTHCCYFAFFFPKSFGLLSQVDFGFARRAQKFDFQNSHGTLKTKDTKNGEKKRKTKSTQVQRRKTNFALNFPDNLAKRAFTPTKLRAQLPFQFNHI